MGVFLVGVVLHSTYVMHWCINSNNEMKERALPKSISSGIGGSSKKKVACTVVKWVYFLKIQFFLKRSQKFEAISYLF